MYPILLRLGPFELYTYGAFLAVAFLVAIFYLATREANRVGLSPELIVDIGIVAILSSIVGARLFYILFYDLQYTLEHPGELLKLRQTGLVFYGGLIFAVGSGLMYCRLKRAPIRLVLDVAAPSIAIGQAIGRIGCLMSGCCYGKPASVPWAIKLPHLEHLRHPTQIYESLGAFGIFLVLMWFRKRKTGDGQVIGRIKKIQENAANDIYVVKSNDGEILLPAVKEIIKSVDLKAKTVTIEPLPGLLELNRKDSLNQS